MLLNSILFLLFTLEFTKAQNDSCVTRQNTLQCFYYPRSTCVVNTRVFSNTTQLYIGDNRIVTLESDLRLFKVINIIANINNVSDECIVFYQTLACLYLYTPCYEEKPVRICEDSCLMISQSQCSLSASYFETLDHLEENIFEELAFGSCDTINDRVDSYPNITGVDYSGEQNCTYVGLPGATNSHGLQGHVKLVTDYNHDNSNIYNTSTSGIVQVLDLNANIWGDVCIEEGTSTEDIRRIAEVVCRSIGYPGINEEPIVRGPSTASGYYMINNLRCSGYENQLSECQHNGYEFKVCTRDRRLHVDCREDEGNIILADGAVKDDHSLSGIPLLSINGSKAEFCADNFTMETGLVICRLLKGTSDVTVSFSSEFEVRDIDLITYNCFGDETRLLQCEQDNGTCVSHERISITCNDLTQTEIHNPVVLSTMDILILLSSIIIAVLVFTIVTVIIFFCRYRNATRKEIIRSKALSMGQTVSTGMIQLNGIERNLSVNSRANLIINNDNQPIQGFPLENPTRPRIVNWEPQLSEDVHTPIQNYMVTTLGADSLPSEADLTLNYITEYCGQDITEYIISIDLLEVGEKIGEGAFGVVHKGRIRGTPTDRVIVREEVAVKTLKDTFGDQELKELLLECSVLKDLQHPNILGLLALTYNGRRPYVITPFMEKGDLKAYLKNVRVKALSSLKLPEELSETLLARISLDITRGMEYMTNKRYVHRDLAARNCILDAELNVKVSDFGLSREIYVDDYYRHVGGKLPAKWMAPESLEDGIYNERTDVWSFGVTLWEIYSLGRNPYPGVGNHEILKFLQEGNKRMEKPKLCPIEIYDLMQYCWQFKPSQRPTFSIITNYLESVKKLESTLDLSLEKTRVAIKEEDEKLHDLEYSESSLNKRQLFRQQAVTNVETPYTTSRVICFEQLASRIDKSGQKAFIMRCAQSVSMDSNKFKPCDRYSIPYMSISIPIKNEEHRARTRTLDTVRQKHSVKYKKLRHTCIGGKETFSSIAEESQFLSPNRLNVPPPPVRRHKNKARLGKSIQFPSNEENNELTKTA